MSTPARNKLRINVEGSDLKIVSMRGRLEEGGIKNGPRIKACVIRPPETPAVFMLFLNWKVNQQMRSAFLVFDLIGRNASLERERNARGFIHPKFDDRKEAVGLVVRENG